MPRTTIATDRIVVSDVNLEQSCTASQYNNTGATREREVDTQRNYISISLA